MRSFTDEGVPGETVNKLLEAAVRAPTAGGIEPWRFFVVRDDDMKEKLSNAALGQSFVAQAPVVIVVCADLDVCAQGYGSRGQNLYAIQDTAAAVQNILLAAVAGGWAPAGSGRSTRMPPRERLPFRREQGLLPWFRWGIPRGHLIRQGESRSRSSPHGCDEVAECRYSSIDARNAGTSSRSWCEVRSASPAPSALRGS